MEAVKVTQKLVNGQAFLIEKRCASNHVGVQYLSDKSWTVHLIRSGRIIWK